MEDSATPQITPTSGPTLPPPRATGLASYPQKAPVLAAFLSFLPGLGNVYNGLYKRAILFFAIFVSFLAISVQAGDGAHLAFFVPCILFVWFFNIFDAYRQANLINFGLRDDVDDARLDMAGWGLAPGVFLLVLGAYGLLRNTFDIEWDWLLDQWPWGVIVLGAWMIFQHFRNRGRSALSPVEEGQA